MSSISTLFTGGALEVVDYLLAVAIFCLFHLPLFCGYDEPETLLYQIDLFGPICAKVRHRLTEVSRVNKCEVKQRPKRTFIEP